MDKHFFSVEFSDEDGYQVIDHAFMTEKEAEILIGEFIKKGVAVSVNRLSRLPDESGSVNSDDVERLLEMGKPDKGVE